MAEPFAGVLICGTSHTGKSTLAARIGQATGASVISTDQMARHPGRPWPEVRAEVAEYYARLSAETIHWLLKAHHENMQCHVLRAIEVARVPRGVFVIEGAALRPEIYAPLLGMSVVGVCLHAAPDFLRARMEVASAYPLRDQRQRQLIDAFVERSLRENIALRDAARLANFVSVDVADGLAADQMAATLIQSLQRAG